MASESICPDTKYAVEKASVKAELIRKLSELHGSVTYANTASIFIYVSIMYT